MGKPPDRPWACDYHRGIHSGCRCMYFEIGLGRTATRSIYMAAHQLGLRAMHATGGCRFCHDDMIEKMRQGRCDYVMYSVYEYCGALANWHWRQLAEERPDAKFVMTTRPLDQWLKSVVPFAKKACQSSHRHDPAFQMRYRKTYGDVKYPSESQLREHYEEHIGGVLEHFTGSDRLLVLDVFTENDESLWSKLAPFLGRAVPEGKKFPKRKSPIRVYDCRNEPI